MGASAAARSATSVTAPTSSGRVLHRSGRHAERDRLRSQLDDIATRVEDSMRLLGSTVTSAREMGMPVRTRATISSAVTVVRTC